MIHYLKIFLSGIAMGIADIIPGVSGGTIAFITGIYQDLLNSIRSLNVRAVRLLITGNVKACFQEIKWKFLVVLGSGIGLSLITCSYAIRFLMHHASCRSYLFAVFLGLIIASVCFCLKNIQRYTFKVYFLLVLGITVGVLVSLIHPPQHKNNSEYDVFIPSYLNESSLNLAENYRIDTQMFTHVSESELEAMLTKQIVTEKTPVYSYQTDKYGHVSQFIHSKTKPTWSLFLIFSGILAVSAMLLPGISGSYILQVIGVYPLVITSIAEMTAALFQGHIDTDALKILINVAMGIVIGGIAFSRLLCWLFKQFRNETLGLMIGFMLGSVKSIWPFFSSTYFIDPVRPLQGLQLHTAPSMPNWLSIHTWMVILTTVISFILFYIGELWVKQNKAKLARSKL